MYFQIRNGAHVALIPKNHGDGYQTLDLKEVSSKGDGYQTLDLKEVSSKTCKTRHTLRLGGNEARKRNTAACNGLEATNAPSFSKVHLISGLKFTSEHFGGNCDSEDCTIH